MVEIELKILCLRISWRYFGQKTMLI